MLSVSLAVTRALSLCRTVTHSLTFIDFSTFVSHTHTYSGQSKEQSKEGVQAREQKRANVLGGGTEEVNTTPR